MASGDDVKPDHLVVLEEVALVDLLVPALEAACVPLPGRKAAHEAALALDYEGLEVGGALWGGTAIDPWTRRHVTTIRRATVSKQSKGTTNSFLYNEAALNIKRALFEALWPQLGFIGRFHTHPYMNTSRTDVAMHALHQPSDPDLRCFQQAGDEKLELIVTLSKKQEASFVPPGWVGFHERGKSDPACVLFGIGDLAVWIRVCMWEHDADGHFGMIAADRLHLHCPAVTGLMLPPGEEPVSFRRVGAGMLERSAPPDKS